jgi:immune inhibitor A
MGWFMTNKGWIACIIGIIVMLCVCMCCFLFSLAGVAGYLVTLPNLSWNIPIPLNGDGSPTPSPVVIRPTPYGLDATPTSPIVVTTPQIESPTPVSEITPIPVSVPTDTLYTLENTFIPINDPIELAHRLLNLDNISPTIAPPSSPYSIGAQQIFWAGNGDNQSNFQVHATLRYITEHAYFWIEDGVHYQQGDLSALADTFENEIYPTDRAFFGSEWTPGVDGDPHIYILYARGLGDHILGYFSSADEYPPQINKYSNSHEMFLINADNSPLDYESTFGTLAHELQHMIHWFQDRNESSWLNEGFSELATLLNNFYTGSLDALYTSNPDLQLNNWPDSSDEDIFAHYGVSFLFVTYFLDRFGETATKSLIAHQDNDLDSVDSTLQQLNMFDPLTGKPISADDFFLDWAITNYLMDPHVGDGRFTYTSYHETPPVEPNQSFSHCPVSTITSDVHQYGVDYFRFNCPGSYTLHFEGSIQTPLLPQDPHSGLYALWSNKNDESDMTLTRSFDLTSYSGKLSLNFWTWYDIEDGWDYVYLEASIDGENWIILNTPSGTAENPQGSNFGWGYTGYSGGGTTPLWINETVDLSQFAGKNLTLRYEYITDSNVTGEGFLLDDLSIPEIGYSTDFETDSAGWQANGWARIQNILPQNYRLALISEGDTTNIQYITLETDITADIPFMIGDSVDNVVLLVSGTTRFTRQLAPYRFNVSQP